MNSKKKLKELKHVKSLDNLGLTTNLQFYPKTTRNELVTNDDDLNDMKDMRITDIFKNPYSINAGKSINNLRLVNNELKKKVNKASFQSTGNLDFLNKYK